MKKIKKGIVARKITIHELFILSQLSNNDFWITESLADNFSSTHSIVAIFSDDAIKSADSLLTLHTIMGIEALLLSNVDNFELIKLSGKKIYENSEEVVKYAKLSTGLLSKCEISADFNDIYKRFFKGRAIIVFKFNVPVPDFEGTIDALIWINLNLKKVSYFVDEEVRDVTIGCPEEISNILSSVYSSVQIVYLRNNKKYIDMTVLSTDNIKRKNEDNNTK